MCFEMSFSTGLELFQTIIWIIFATNFDVLCFHQMAYLQARFFCRCHACRAHQKSENFQCLKD